VVIVKDVIPILPGDQLAICPPLYFLLSNFTKNINTEQKLAIAMVGKALCGMVFLICQSP